MEVFKIIKENEREEITMKNMNLIHSRAHSFNRTTGIDYDELFSVACIGFTKALNNYNSNYNVKFSTYAYRCINNELRRFISKEKRHRDTFITVPDVYPAKTS